MRPASRCLGRLCDKVSDKLRVTGVERCTAVLMGHNRRHGKCLKVIVLFAALLAVPLLIGFSMHVQPTRSLDPAATDWTLSTLLPGDVIVDTQSTTGPPTTSLHLELPDATSTESRHQQSFRPAPSSVPLQLMTSSSSATSALLTAPGNDVTASTSPAVRVDQYVSLSSGGFPDGRGLGNQMFDLATVLYVAQLTGRRPALITVNYTYPLQQVFRGIDDIDQLPSICPCLNINSGRVMAYERRFDELTAANLTGKSITLSGFYQTWRYTLLIGHLLRSRYFVFRDVFRQFADSFMRDVIVPTTWMSGGTAGAGYIRVGVHVRRGDVLNDDKVKFGYTTPTISYFRRAMRHFLDSFVERVLFIVTSNDLSWCRQHFTVDNILSNTTTPTARPTVTDNNNTHNNNNNTTTTTAPTTTTAKPRTFDDRFGFVFSDAKLAGEDLALLASCDHVIISTGTFGWWGAWLAGGTTVYYSDWPRNGSTLHKYYEQREYFPPTWIPFTD